MDKDKLSLLFKTLQKALKSHSINDITDAVSSFLSKKADKHEEVHYVLEIVCSEFNISKRMLTHSPGKGNVFTARNIAYCILHYNLSLPVRHIATIIPKKTHTSVFKAVAYFKTINTDIKVDREFKEVYDRIALKLSEFIENKNKQHYEKEIKES